MGEFCSPFINQTAYYNGLIKDVDYILAINQKEDISLVLIGLDLEKRQHLFCLTFNILMQFIMSR